MLLNELFSGFRTSKAADAARIAASDEFKKWFGSSVLKTKTSPRMFFHGTKSDFEKFDPSYFFSGSSDDDDETAGFYFTTNVRLAARYSGSKGRIVPAFLNVENPYTVSALDWAHGKGLSPQEALAEGHDGYIINGQEKGTTVIVFSSKNIWQI